MDPARHGRLMELFDELCDLPDDEQARRLGEVRAKDAVLAADLGAMLGADKDGAARLDSSPVSGLEDTFIPNFAVPPGSASSFPGGEVTPARIGEYRIIRRIGTGGMGIVYEAAQELPQRRVAIKVIREDVATPGMRRRFLAESHILARLNHPGIAQIYEAASEGALLYLVMELVEGDTLTRFADARKLDLRGRLELLASVCDALAHAHAKGVIHRDLKPANILVAHDGQPKVLDFGIARVIAADSRPGNETLAGQLMGTPAYMSPEQTSFEPGQLDLRSDVYTLGVIGYELLCGRLPHDVAGKQVLEVMRMIREVPPMPPGRLRPALRGDPDTILRKALALEPADRYQSAAALAEDIRRYLADEPIAARPPSLWYQLGKFARRRRALAAALGGLALSILVGAVTVLILYFQVDAARGLAERERVAAVTARGLAEQAQAEAEAQSRALIERSDALILVDARAQLPVDATRAVARLKGLSPAGNRWREGAILADEARARGAALDVLDGHADEIEAVVWSPDGKVLVTASKDHTLRRWEPATRSVRVLANHLDQVHALAAAPSGRMASGDGDGVVWLWDERGAPIVRCLGHGAAIATIAWAPDGSWFATADDAGEIRRWSAAGGPLGMRRAHGASIEQIEISADGARLASAGGDGVVGVWHVADDRAEDLRGHRGGVARVRFLPDGTLVSAGLDGSVRRWGARPGVLVQGAAEVKELRVLSNGMVWADRAGSLGFLGADGRPGRTLAAHAGVVRDIAVAPDGSIATAGDDRVVRLWSATGEPRGRLGGHRGRVSRVAFAPKGDRLVSVGDEHTARIWSATSPPGSALVGAPPARRVRFAPSGTLVAAAHENDRVVVYDVTGARQPVELAGPAELIYDVVWSADAQLVAAASRDKRVYVWPATGGAPRILPCPARATMVAVSSRGVVAAATIASDIPVLELASGRVTTLRGHSGRVNGIVFTDDGRLLSASDDRSVWIWDLASGRGEVFGPLAERALRVGITGDRAVVTLADGAVWARPLAGGPPLSAHGHAGEIPLLAPLPGPALATGGVDGKIVVWRPLLLPSVVGEHGGRVSALIAGPGGILYSGSDDQTVVRWTPGKPRERLVRAAGPIRDLAVSADDTWLAVAAEGEPLRLLPTRATDDPAIVRAVLTAITAAEVTHDEQLTGGWTD